MEALSSAVKFVVEHYQEILSAILAICSGLIAIFLFVPGPQPEKALQGFVDFISKFSKKPADPK